MGAVVFAAALACPGGSGRDSRRQRSERDGQDHVNSMRAKIGEKGEEKVGFDGAHVTSMAGGVACARGRRAR